MRLRLRNLLCLIWPEEPPVVEYLYIKPQDYFLDQFSVILKSIRQSFKVVSDPESSLAKPPEKDPVGFVSYHGLPMITTDPVIKTEVGIDPALDSCCKQGWVSLDDWTRTEM